MLLMIVGIIEIIIISWNLLALDNLSLEMIWKVENENMWILEDLEFEFSEENDWIVLES